MRAALGLALLLGANFRVCADTPLHSLWELHGARNTVYLLGSIHVLRAGDYPLAPAVEAAYAKAAELVMEVDLGQVDLASIQADMLAAATLPAGVSLPRLLGERRYARAAALAREAGVELATFDRFAPWFVAEAVSTLELEHLGFSPQSGVEMHFLELARRDGKAIGGLESVRDQIDLFAALAPEAQAEYLVSSLEDVHDLPREVDGLIQAWQRGDTAWLAAHLDSELARDPKLYEAVLAARNRKWLPRIEALLKADRNYLVIVGAGHLAGRNSLVELLAQHGLRATQR